MTRIRRVLTAGWIACAASAAWSPAAAQTVSASLAGRVASKDGAPIAGAFVQARSESSGALRTATTDSGGRYRFDILPPGAWSVVARDSEGTLSDTKTITLSLQQAGQADLVMGAGLAEELTVNAVLPLVDPHRTGGELRILGDQADDLPLAGRNATDLALLDSSVRWAAPASYYGERAAPFVINGQTGRANSYRVDGLDNNDQVSGTTLNAQFSDLVISEFVLLTHQFAPEFGRASGGVLNIVTERGTNQSEALAFVQGAPGGMGSSGSLVDSLPDTPGVPSTSSNWAAGMRWGGPIKKDRAFWFAAYEHQSSSPVLPYTGVTQDGVAGGRTTAPATDDNFFLRTDFNLDPSNSLMVRLSYDRRSTSNLNVGGVATPAFGFGLDEEDIQLGATLTSVLSPTLIHELRILGGSSGFEQDANSTASGVERPSAQFGGNNLSHQTRDAATFEVVGNLTALRGPHTVKFGYDVTPSRTKVSARFNPNGNFIYRTDAPFEPGDCGDLIASQVPRRCSGNPSRDCAVDPAMCERLGEGTCEARYDIPVDCPGVPGFDDDGDTRVDEPGLLDTYPLVYQLIEGAPDTTLTNTAFALFAQDSWQLSPRWLLDYGLRYDLDTYTLPESATVPSSIPNGGAGRDYNDLAPRLGFTYQAGRDRNWLIRGGAGVFYNKAILAFPAVAAITSGTQIGLLFPQGLTLEITEDVIAQYGIDAIRPGLIFPENLTLRFSTGTRLDSTQASLFNLGVERKLGRRGSLNANLTRAITDHVPLMRDLNPVVAFDPNGVPIHRDTATGSIAAIVTEGQAWYSGLDLAWKWRGAASWYSLSYTLSKAEDLGPDPLKGGIYLPPNSDDLSLERGPSDHDRRHRFVAAGDIALHFAGLRLSGVYQYATPIPFNVTTGTDDNSDGITSDRPPGVGRNTGASTPLEPVNAYRALSGLAPVSSLTAPDFSQLDLRIYRSFAFGDSKARGQAFVQIFNVLDHFNGGLVEGRALAANFGAVIATAGPPRSVELGWKMEF